MRTEHRLSIKEHSDLVLALRDVLCLVNAATLTLRVNSITFFKIILILQVLKVYGS